MWFNICEANKSYWPRRIDVECKLYSKHLWREIKTTGYFARLLKERDNQEKIVVVTNPELSEVRRVFGGEG